MLRGYMAHTSNIMRKFRKKLMINFSASESGESGTQRIHKQFDIDSESEWKVTTFRNVGSANMMTSSDILMMHSDTSNVELHPAT